MVLTTGVAIQQICSQQLTSLALKQHFNQAAQSNLDKAPNDVPSYDLFDDFLSQLFQISYEPSETRNRTTDMVYLQPTPGRIILEMINEVSFTASDYFYDLGSGLGQVSLLVSLLTDAVAVGIEYEPTYVQYARCVADKLRIVDVEFRNLDARDADFSDGTIFFMYTPFTGNILRDVLDRLHDVARTHPITICTYGSCTTIVERELWLYPIKLSQGATNRLAIFRSNVLP